MEGSVPLGKGLPLGHGAEVLLSEVVETLLEKQGGGGTLSDGCLTALHSIFQQNLVPALDLVERGGVTKYVCSSVASGGRGTVNRELYVVQGSTGNQYVCLTTSRYCSCPSFAYSVLVKGDALLCKHQLAVRLAVAVGRCETVEVSGEEWATLAGMDAKP